MTKDGKTAVIQQNIYNGDGQRIQKIDGDETINYYYQDGVVAYTTDAAGEQNSQNLIGTEGNILAIQRYQKDTTQYYLYNKDIQGSTTSLVKEDGSADATYQYTDFGETTIHGDDQADNEVCYTGGIYDQTTGLYYLNARYYDPEEGRFLTEDTYRGENDQPDTQHLYVYCANNPVNYVDPSGHQKSTYSLCYYDNRSKKKKLTEQAFHSPYYKTENASVRSVSDFDDLKICWNNITNNVRKLFLYFHGQAGSLEFKQSGSIPSNRITNKNGFKKKSNLREIYLIICHGAVGGSKKERRVSVARRFYDLTNKKANVYASKYYVNFRYAKKKGRSDKVYYPKYGGIDKIRDLSGKKNPVKLTYRRK